MLLTRDTADESNQQDRAALRLMNCQISYWELRDYFVLLTHAKHSFIK